MKIILPDGSVAEYWSFGFKENKNSRKLTQMLKEREENARSKNSQ